MAVHLHEQASLRGRRPRSAEKMLAKKGPVRVLGDLTNRVCTHHHEGIVHRKTEQKSAVAVLAIKCAEVEKQNAMLTGNIKLLIRRIRQSEKQIAILVDDKHSLLYENTKLQQAKTTLQDRVGVANKDISHMQGTIDDSISMFNLLESALVERDQKLDRMKKKERQAQKKLKTEIDELESVYRLIELNKSPNEENSSVPVKTKADAIQSFLKEKDQTAQNLQKYCAVLQSQMNKQASICASLRKQVHCAKQIEVHHQTQKHQQEEKQREDGKRKCEEVAVITSTPSVQKIHRGPVQHEAGTGSLSEKKISPAMLCSVPLCFPGVQLGFAVQTDGHSSAFSGCGYAQLSTTCFAKKKED